MSYEVTNDHWSPCDWLNSITCFSGGCVLAIAHTNPCREDSEHTHDVNLNSHIGYKCLACTTAIIKMECWYVCVRAKSRSLHITWMQYLLDVEAMVSIRRMLRPLKESPIKLKWNYSRGRRSNKERHFQHLRFLSVLGRLVALWNYSCYSTQRNYNTLKLSR